MNSPVTSTAVGFLRSRTLRRALREHVRFVRETYGWPTVVFVLGWVALFVANAVQTLLRESHAQERLPLAMLAGVVVPLLVLGWSVLSSRVPPVILNRRDVLRLGLCPVPAHAALAWPLWCARAFRALIGGVLGGVWSLVAPVHLGVHAPWAGMVVATLLAASVDVAWMAYAARQQDGGAARRWLLVVSAFTVAGVGIGWFTPLGLGGALVSASPLGLLGPALLAALAGAGVRASLRVGFPPGFTAHALVLGQLRALSLSSLWTRSAPDPDVVRRWRSQLHGHSDAVRPSRFLKAPPMSWGPRGAVLWRSALMWWRRPWTAHAQLLMQFVGVGVASAGPLEGTARVAFTVLLTASVLRQLLGPPPGGSLPGLTGRDRTWGRAAPGLLVTLGVTLLAVVGAVMFDQVVIAGNLVLAGVQVMLATVMFEKLTAGWGFSAASSEVAIGSAFLALLPGLVVPGGLAFACVGAALMLLLRLRWV